jgi:hypothetical protein
LSLYNGGEQFFIKEEYMNLPYNLSGTMSKNRFKNEILWGIHKILELYKYDKDFNMVFECYTGGAYG